MSDNARPEANQVPVGTNHELTDELSPSEEEKISGGLNLDGIKGECQDPPADGKIH
jgi:hypothetical protein